MAVKYRGGRTFATVLDLMERYPDFTFNQSSAQLYAWIEEDAPISWSGSKNALPRSLGANRRLVGRARLADHRWRVVRSPALLWATRLRSDVRQALNGRVAAGRLPEFSGGIPQLLRGAGSTVSSPPSSTGTKRTVFPYDLFTWKAAG